MHSGSDCVLPAQNRQRSFFISVPGSAGLTCLFGAFVFLQFSVLALANRAGDGYLAAGQREFVYYALQIFVISGYLLYGLFSRFVTDIRIRSICVYAVFSVLLAFVAMMLFAGTASLLSVIVSMAAALCVGLIGGSVHLRMSRETAVGADVARCMGIGSAAAVALQYLLQIRIEVPLLLFVFMLAALFLSVFMTRVREPEGAAEEGRKPADVLPRQIIFSILIAAAFILFACFYNETVHHLMIRSGYASYNVYSWPRLMLIPGYLLFALIGSRKNGKYLSIAALCTMLIMLLNVVLIGDSGTYWLNMCLFYFSIAAFTSYYNLTFWRLAQGTRHPEFWAPFGRMLDSAMVLFAGAIHLSSFPAPVVLGLDIAGIAMVILLMAINGDFNLSEADAARADAGVEIPFIPLESVPSESVPSESVPSESVSSESVIIPESDLPLQDAPAVMEADDSSRLSPDDTLAQMKERFLLTPREVDVFRELVMTEDTQAAISDRLLIQVRTLQTYVTRIYRKTGTSTRAGLADLYHEIRNKG